MNAPAPILSRNSIFSLSFLQVVFMLLFCSCSQLKIFCFYPIHLVVFISPLAVKLSTYLGRISTWTHYHYSWGRFSRFQVDNESEEEEEETSKRSLECLDWDEIKLNAELQSDSWLKGQSRVLSIEFKLHVAEQQQQQQRLHCNYSKYTETSPSKCEEESKKKKRRS